MRARWIEGGLVQSLTMPLPHRYHTGSLAFGALILAIVQIIRVILEYLDQRLKGEVHMLLTLALNWGVVAQGQIKIGGLMWWDSDWFLTWRGAGNLRAWMIGSHLGGATESPLGGVLIKPQGPMAWASSQFLKRGLGWDLFAERRAGLRLLSFL